MICSPELLVGWIFGWVMCPSSQGEEGEIKTIEQRKAAAGGAGLRHPCAIVPKTRQNNVGNRPHWSYLQCQQGKHFFFPVVYYGSCGRAHAGWQVRGWGGVPVLSLKGEVEGASPLLKLFPWKFKTPSNKAQLASFMDWVFFLT